MGSPGTGSAPHLTAELFMQMAGLQMTHVPYRGAAPAFIDLIPGRIDCYFGSGELLTYSRSGQARCLATTGTNSVPGRARTFPPWPSPDCRIISSIPGRASFCRARRTPDIVQKFNADVVKVLAKPAVIDLLAQTAYTAKSSTPDELRDFLKEDSAKWNAVIKQAGVKVE